MMSWWHNKTTLICLNKKMSKFPLIIRLSSGYHIVLLTSNNPCRTRTHITTCPCINVIANGTNKCSVAELAMDKPKILLAGNFDAMKPPGICVIK